jgi:predicted Zn-dependent protease
MTRATGMISGLALASLTAGCAHLQRGAANLRLPADQEAELAGRIDEQIHARYPVLRDPATVDPVRRVGARVGAASARERGPVDLHFEVIDDPRQVNAFAAPGGNIYVFSGERGQLSQIR